MYRVLPIAVSLLATLAVCRFTVRDVGFVDLGDKSYELVGFISEKDQPEQATRFTSLAAAILAESNVVARCVDPDTGTGDPAYKFLRELKIQTFPAAVLIAPDGRARPVPLLREGSTFADSAGLCIEALVSSTRRTAVLDAVLAHFCVVVTAEGEDAAANQASHTAVAEAFAEIEKIFDRMPKAVGDLPVEITIPFAERESEALLLWSLGIDDGPATEPATVVLFGRARRVGPALTGAAIDTRSVFGILANIGQSCECGLDRSWMRGTRVPIRWDEDTRSRATKLLGFDPDSPMVKAEVSSILARGGSAQKADEGSSVEALLLGYSEMAVIESPVAETHGPSAGATSGHDHGALEVENFEDFGAFVWSRTLFYGLSILVGFCAVIGTGIYLLRRRS